MWKFIGEKYKQLSENLLALISAIIVFSIFLFILSLSVDNKSLSSFFYAIAVSGFTAAFFQILLKSDAFLEMVQKGMDIYERQWKNYTQETILKVLTAIQKAHPSVEFSMNTKKESYKLSKEALLERKQAALQVNESLRDENEKLLVKRNFHINESRMIKTILLNGCEISTYELDIVMIKDGIFSFNYKVSTSMDNVKFEPFDYFKKHQKLNERFNDYSFSAEILHFYDKNGNMVDTEKIPHLSVYIDKDDDEGDTEKRKNIKMSISQECEEGDTFCLSFSITTKDEYVRENIEKIKNKDAEAPKTTVSVPVGVRHMLIQEEIYCNDVQGVSPLNLRPWLKVSGNRIKSKYSKTIFYKKNKWSIYYAEYPNASIEYSVV